MNFGGSMQTSEVYKIKVDETNLTQLTNYSNNNTVDKSSKKASWTNKNNIIFISHKYQSLGEIYQMNSDGTNVLRLTNNTKMETFPKSK